MDWIITLVVLSAAIAAGPFVWGWVTEKPLTAAEQRKHAPGQSVKLPEGTIHYCVEGSEQGPVVVLVHGFSAPLFVFEQNAAWLAKAGFRVIRFDHFGRGWSDRPKGNYDPEFYDAELLNLFDALDLREPVGAGRVFHGRRHLSRIHGALSRTRCRPRRLPGPCGCRLPQEKSGRCVEPGN